MHVGTNQHQRQRGQGGGDGAGYLHGTGTGSGGSQIRFTTRGHFVLDKRTGQVRRNPIISTCRIS